MSPTPVPAWLNPPEGGFTAEDLDHLPDLPPHTELIDGRLVFRSPQTVFHSLAVDMLEEALLRTAPADLRVRRGITITLGTQQPDIVVIRTAAEHNEVQASHVGSAVVLVVEVVSLESRPPDRERKPRLYAEAGIRHFWRVEREQDKGVLYAYRLDHSKGAYEETRRYEGAVSLDVPYPIKVDFSDIDRLWA